MTQAVRWSPVLPVDARCYKGAPSSGFFGDDHNAYERTHLRTGHIVGASRRHAPRKRRRIRFLDALAWQRRRGLWRYRHQPALRPARGRGGGKSCRRLHQPGCRARRAVAHPVGADRRRDLQIRSDPPARRQQRRGWNFVAHGAGEPRLRTPHGADLYPRRDRRLDVPRRFRDHAGHFRAFGGRGAQTRDARVRPLCRRADRCHPGRPVRGAKPRHRQGCGLLRAGHGGLVRDHRDRGPGSRQRRPARAAGDQSILRGAVPGDARPYRHGHAGPRVSRGDWRRGALCRSRTFRPQTDPDRLARPRAAVAAAQLFWPGGAGAGRIRPRSKIHSTA